MPEKFQSHQYQEEAEKKKSHQWELQTIFSRKKIFHKKLANLDFHCYQLRSVQNQKDTKQVGFILCKS